MTNPGRTLAAIAAAAACILGQAPAGAQDGTLDPPSLDSTRATLAQWLETRQIIAKEKADWETARDVLEQRSALLEREAATLEEKIAELAASLGEIDGKRGELRADHHGLEDASLVLAGAIGPLEAKALRLLRTVPDPLRERVAVLSGRIPADPSATKLSLSERWQNVIGVLNEINKFNREITVTSEVRTLPGGKSAEVKAIYLGLGQAYFVSSGGDAAAIGRPGSDGWEWTPANDLAAPIAEAIAILQNEKTPAYVPLPVVIR